MRADDDDLALAALIKQSKQVGIYDDFVKPYVEKYNINISTSSASLEEYIQDLLELQKHGLTSRQDIKDSFKQSISNNNTLQVVRALVMLLEKQLTDSAYVDLITKSGSPEETVSTIITLTRYNRPDLIQWGVTLRESAMTAETMGRLEEKGLLTTKLVRDIDRLSKRDDTFIKIISLFLDAECLDEMRLERIRSMPIDYLSSVRWTLSNIRNFIFDHEASVILDWFFPLKPLASIPIDFVNSLFWKLPPLERTQDEINRVNYILSVLDGATLTPTYLFKKQYEWLLSDQALQWFWDVLPINWTSEQKDGLVAGLLQLLDTLKNPSQEDVLGFLVTYQNSERDRTKVSTYSQGEYADFLDLHPNVEIPEKYICPITRGIMTNPMTSDGKSYYEEKALRHHIETNHKHPLTGQPVTMGQFYSVPAMKKEIDDFMDKAKESIASSKPLAPHRGPSV